MKKALRTFLIAALLAQGLVPQPVHAGLHPKRILKASVRALRVVVRIPPFVPVALDIPVERFQVSGPMFPGPGMPAASGVTPIAIVAHTLSANQGATSGNVNTTGASAYVIGLISYDADACAVGDTPTDSKGNTYIAIDNSPGSPPSACLWYVLNPTTDAALNFTPAGTFQAAFFVAMSHVKTSSALDVHGVTNTGSSVSTLQTSTLTPSVDNEICVFAGGSYDPGETAISFASPSVVLTISDSATSNLNAVPNAGGALGYQIQTTATAVDSTYTHTGGSGGATVTAGACFKHD